MAILKNLEKVAWLLFNCFLSLEPSCTWVLRQPQSLLVGALLRAQVRPTLSSPPGCCFCPDSPVGGERKTWKFLTRPTPSPFQRGRGGAGGFPHKFIKWVPLSEHWLADRVWRAADSWTPAGRPAADKQGEGFPNPQPANPGPGRKTMAAVCLHVNSVP